MGKTIRIEGMGCDACVTTVEKALKPLDPGVKVTLSPPQAQFSDGAAPDSAAIAKALAAAGSYRPVS